MTYGIDFREKVLEFLDRGRTMREAADVFGIALGSVTKWKRKLLNTGGLEDAPRRAGFRKLDPEKLRAHVAAHPDAYLAEIGEAFGCNESAVRKAFAKLRITRKKTKRFREQRPEQVERYLAECAGRPVAYVDETGIDTWLCREHGWSERGAPVVGEVRGRKYERVGVVAALMGKELVAPYMYGDNMDSGFFEGWFETALLPAPARQLGDRDGQRVFPPQVQAAGACGEGGTCRAFPAAVFPGTEPHRELLGLAQAAAAKNPAGLPDFRLCVVFRF
jgi:transposase